MKQYNNISVFKAKPSQNAKAPQFNVVIEMADGTKWRGGLWEATSKAGTKYLRGSLDEDTGNGDQPRASKRNDDPPFEPNNNSLVDW
jgi:uncharacterized protein (DUF736 family)